MIRDILKTIVNASNDPGPAQAKVAGEPCVVCGQPTANFCGMCVREGKTPRVPICQFEANPACQREHATAAHREGQVAETDPLWVG